MDTKRLPLKQLKVPRKTFFSDMVSGAVMAIVSVPAALGGGILAGVNPIFGVYSIIAGTTVAALFTSSVIMNVDVTGVTALATRDALEGVDPGQHHEYLVVLGLLVGLFMLIMGVLKLGSLTKYISNAVMTGLITGIGVLTIISQCSDLTGYQSQKDGKVFQFFDTIAHYQDIDEATLSIGLLTILMILLLRPTRLGRYSYVVAVVGATLIVLLPSAELVAVVGDSIEIPRGLPTPNIPDFSLIASMIVPALGIAIIALVQAAGLSDSLPNPDGNYPDPSGDFRGQGAGNISAGLFGGLAIGGSLSGTTLLRNIGGISRWSNIFYGLFALVILLFLAPLIEILPMPALGGLLVMVGVSIIKVPRIITVWHTSVSRAAIMLITFSMTLFLPVYLAVLIGVGVHILLYVFRSAEKVRIERIIPRDDGSYFEGEVPDRLSTGQVVVLMPVGSLFFAGASAFESQLPESGDARRAVVIIRLRDRDEVGSTFIRIMERYTRRMNEQGNRVIIAGVSERVLEQFKRTGLINLIGEEDIFLAEAEFRASLQKALAVAQQWVNEGDFDGET